MFSVYLIGTITTILFYFSKPSGFDFFAHPWQVFSQLFALIGICLFCLNYILSSRARFLENIFGGLDKVYKTHHTIGTLAFVLIINHPIFLAVNALPNSVAARNYLFLGRNLAYNLGVMSLYTMILVLIFTFIIKLPYHHWLSIHKLMGIPLFVVIFHVLLIDSDVSNFLPLRFWIIILLVLAVAGYIYKLIFYARLGPIFQYKVTSIDRIGSISNIFLAPLNTPLLFKAGQYIFATFHQQYIPTESHPFTVSSSPHDSLIRLSIKSLGDFTTVIAGLKTGSPVTLLGPYGQFAARFYQNRPVVCIAGGIGVTPFLSMIGAETKNPLSRPIYFYYSVKTVPEAVYDTEIKSYQSVLPNLIYHLHDTATLKYLTAAKIKTDVPAFNNAVFFICGPPQLMSTLSAQLQQLGIKTKDIIYEDFDLVNVN